MNTHSCLGLTALVLVVGCGSPPPTGQGGSGGGGGTVGAGGAGGGGSLCGSTATGGTFKLLTYNVAGLPEGISGSHPLVDLPLISPLLNGYDMVAVQENFTWADYPQRLSSAARHPYKSI